MKDIMGKNIYLGAIILYAYPSLRRAGLRFGIIRDVSKTTLTVRGYKKTKDGKLGYFNDRVIVLDRELVSDKVLDWLEQFCV